MLCKACISGGSDDKTMDNLKELCASSIEELVRCNLGTTSPAAVENSFEVLPEVAT
jgi:hypothetical protein